MYKAYKSVLENLFPNSRHVTSSAHKIALKADTYFCKPPDTRKRYLDFLKDMHDENIV